MQGVNLGSHQVVERIVHQTMPLDRVQAVEFRGHDGQGVVTATGAGSGVTGVLGRIISDFDSLGAKTFAQALLDRCDPVVGRTLAQGRTLRNGLTDTALYTPAAM